MAAAVCTAVQMRTDLQESTVSNHTGVSWHKKAGKWQAFMKIGKCVSVWLSIRFWTTGIGFPAYTYARWDRWRSVVTVSRLVTDTGEYLTPCTARTGRWQAAAPGLLHEPGALPVHHAISMYSVYHAATGVYSPTHPPTHPPPCKTRHVQYIDAVYPTCRGTEVGVWPDIA